MTNDEFLKWLLESEYDYRRNVSIERLIRSANFRYKAYMEKIDYTINGTLTGTSSRDLLLLIL